MKESLPHYNVGTKQISRITDRYNTNKVWIIKRYKDGHYYLNQEISHKMFYTKYTRTTLKHINEVLFR